MPEESIRLLAWRIWRFSVEIGRELPALDCWLIAEGVLPLPAWTGVAFCLAAFQPADDPRRGG